MSVGSELTPAPGGDGSPTVAAADDRGWARWLFRLAHFGKAQVAKLGLVLALGFGLGVLALVGFAGLAEDVMEKETIVLDDGVASWLLQFSSPGLDRVMHGLSMMGAEALVVLLPLLLVGLAWQRRYGAAVSLVIVVAGAQLLNNVLKDLFQRTRPAPVESFIAAQQFSFPSGHAMVSAAFYLFVAFLAWRLLRGWWRFAAPIGLGLLVVAIGVSRIYLQAHYFTDVVAGYAVGFIWVDAVIIGGSLLRPKSKAESRAAAAATGVGTS